MSLQSAERREQQEMDGGQRQRWSLMRKRKRHAEGDREVRAADGEERESSGLERRLGTVDGK